jgi:hypothetical protein
MFLIYLLITKGSRNKRGAAPKNNCYLLTFLVLLCVFTACFSSYLLMPRRKVLVSSVPVLQALYNMVKCTSSRTRIRIGTAVCNLLSCPETNRAAINAGALSVVKIIATMDF